MSTSFSRFAAVLLLGVLAGVARGEEPVDPAAAFKAQNWTAAEKGYAQLVEEQPTNALAWYRLGYARHALGRYEDALAAHEKAAGMTFSGQATAGYNATCACALLGRKDDAIAWLGKATQAGFKGGALLDLDTDLTALRDDERFWKVRNQLVNASRFRSLVPSGQGNARQFDFWIGDWESNNFSADGKGGWKRTSKLQSRVFPVVDGNALVEYSESPTGNGSMIGFSVRTFDPRANEWVLILNWPSQDKPSFYSLAGRVQHRRGEFVSWIGKAASGGATQSRFSFSDIAKDSYRWDSASTSDGGNSWRTTLLFAAKRRPADAPKLTIGPSRTNNRAKAAVFRGFDFLIGSWKGTRRTFVAEGKWSTQPVTLTTQSIMEGAALDDRWTIGAGDDPDEVYAVRSYEPQRKTWVQYDIDNRAPRFRRFVGVVNGDQPIEMKGTPGPGSSGADGSLVWTERTSKKLKSEWRVKKRVIWTQELDRVE